MEHFQTTLATVVKVGIASGCGMLAGMFFPPETRAVTRRDVGTLLNYLLLPCLVFTKLVESLTLEMVVHCYKLVVLAFWALFVSWCVVKLLLRIPRLRACVGEEFVPLVMVTSIYPNIIVLPVAIMQSLLHVGLISDVEYDRAVSYIFVYNTPVWLMMYSHGNWLIKIGAETEVKAEEDAALALQMTMGSAASYDDEVMDLVSRVALHDNKASGTFREVCNRKALRSLVNGPLVATAVGFIVALIPFLRHVIVDVKPINSVFSSMKLIAGGAVPVLIVQLGMNFVPAPGDRTKVASPTAAAVGPGDDQDGRQPVGGSGMTPIKPRGTSPPRPIVGTDGTAPGASGSSYTLKPLPVAVLLIPTIIRLFLTPALFVPYLYLWQTKSGIFMTDVEVTVNASTLQTNMTSPIATGQVTVTTEVLDHILLFVALICHCTPTNIILSGLCAIHGYKPRECSALLFFMYGVAVFTITGWMTLMLSIAFGK